jgi:cephalosporin-C deacetylase
MTQFDLPLHELERYAPEVSEPADFDAFWRSTLDAARTASPVLDLRPETTGLQLVDTWDVTFAGFGGAPIRAWFTRPAGRGRRRWGPCRPPPPAPPAGSGS